MERGGKDILGILSVVVVDFIFFFIGFFWVSSLGEDWGYSLFSPILNRLEEEGKEEVSVVLLSLVSIRGCFFLGLLGYSIL